MGSGELYDSLYAVCTNQVNNYRNMASQVDSDEKFISEKIDFSPDFRCPKKPVSAQYFVSFQYSGQSCYGYSTENNYDGAILSSGSIGFKDAYIEYNEKGQPTLKASDKYSKNIDYIVDYSNPSWDKATYVQCSKNKDAALYSRYESYIDEDNTEILASLESCYIHDSDKGLYGSFELVRNKTENGYTVVSSFYPDSDDSERFVFYSDYDDNGKIQKQSKDYLGDGSIDEVVSYLYDEYGRIVEKDIDYKNNDAWGKLRQVWEKLTGGRFDSILTYDYKTDNPAENGSIAYNKGIFY